MGYLTWDVNISDQELLEILKDPADKRFFWSVARLLSRAPFWEVFKHYLAPELFIQVWPHVKAQLNLDAIGAGRIEFWDWVYAKIVARGNSSAS